MRRYIIIPCILSIVGHSIFFCVFKPDIKSKLSYPNPQLYLITEEQFDYFASPSGVRDVVISPFPKSLSSKNTIWRDTLDILRDASVMELDVEIKEDSELLDDLKKYNFSQILIPGIYPDSSRNLSEDFVPMFSDLFHSGLLPEKIRQNGENILRLNNDMQMSYYIQGPVLSRGLISSGVPQIKFNIDNNVNPSGIGVKAKFRFWITKDGRVNQVIVEEGSSFPLIDSEIVNLIKTWCFNPMSDPEVPNYEWGIVSIRLQR